jgi:hypothetical protein
MTRTWLLVVYMTFGHKPAAIFSPSCTKHHAHQHLPRSACLRIFYLCNHEIVVENLFNIIIRTVVWGKENKYILFYSILFYSILYDIVAIKQCSLGRNFSLHMKDLITNDGVTRFDGVPLFYPQIIDGSFGSSSDSLRFGSGFIGSGYGSGSRVLMTNT